MNATSSSTYTTKQGVEKRYIAYSCTGYPDGSCTNNCRVPEPWLREVVLGLVGKRLFFDEINEPQSDQSDSVGDAHPDRSGAVSLVDRLLMSERFAEFVNGVQHELDHLESDDPGRGGALLQEQGSLQSRCQGWMQSLGNPSLPSGVRDAITLQYGEADARLREIVSELTAITATKEKKRDAVDARMIAMQLAELDRVLKTQNPSATNVELSHHIDAILCGRDRRVIVRTCKLGALAGGMDLVPRELHSDNHAVDRVNDKDNNCIYLIEPRRREKRNTGDAMENDESAACANDFAVNPSRFAGLAAEWFSEDVFVIPRTLGWAEINAKEVAEYRLSTGQTEGLTAEHFGVSIPTVRKALRLARNLYDLSATGKSVSLKTRKNWARDNAGRVYDFFRGPGATMKAAVVVFEKTDTTIRNALNMAKSQMSIERLTDHATHAPSADGV